jgi:LytS/YehU family sensor histidine kinase
MALQNIRERLLSHYGPGASLELISAQPGTRAVIRLPIEPGAAVAAH